MKKMIFMALIVMAPNSFAMSEFFCAASHDTTKKTREIDVRVTIDQDVLTFSSSDINGNKIVNGVQFINTSEGADFEGSNLGLVNVAHLLAIPSKDMRQGDNGSLTLSGSNTATPNSTVTYGTYRCTAL